MEYINPAKLGSAVIFSRPIAFGIFAADEPGIFISADAEFWSFDGLRKLKELKAANDIATREHPIVSAVEHFWQYLSKETRPRRFIDHYNFNPALMDHLRAAGDCTLLSIAEIRFAALAIAHVDAYLGRPPSRTISLTVRRAVMSRDAGVCRYCGDTENITLDHVMPWSRGGASTIENLVCACRRCNITKSDRTPEEAGMTLLEPEAAR